nr:MAG: ORF1 [Torque teno midi virus]
MPFWWRRRNRPWYGNWRKRRYTRRYRKSWNKTRRRRRPRRFTRRRRRRRRRHKVRRKRKTIPIRQWQPDRIINCKIKGLGYLVAGADGNQFHCYTNTKKDYVQPKAPGGGGFGLEVFTLRYLYQQWIAHKNIWTKSNDYTDLVRYTGCKFTFFRHPTTDFIVAYDRQPPFNFDKETYPDCHPQALLLKKHHRVIQSVKYNPIGRPKTTVRIKPPKQMITKWFFQPDFAEVPLFKLQGAALNLGYSLYGPNTQSPNITLHCLNTQFYQLHNWANASITYFPYDHYPQTESLTFYLANGKSSTMPVRDSTPSGWSQAKNISYDYGWFRSGVLQAIEVKRGDQHQHERPIALGRYNPEEDTGQGNRVWLASIFSTQAWQKPTDKDLIIGELPLYQCFFGLWDYIQQHFHTDYLKTHMFVIQSEFIKILTPTEQKVWPILDLTFIQGKMPYEEALTVQEKAAWYPSCYKQLQVINDIVESGPYVPKYTNLTSSSWQLAYRYTFYFKWGGAQVGEKIVQDPKDQEKYPVPDTLYKTIQISDPMQNLTETILKPWDFRRGIITKKALRRMSENLPIDENFYFDESEPQKKKRKITSEIQCQNKEEEEIQSCLLSLYEKDTFPEDTDNLKLLIHQQYEQQQQLKQNLFKLLRDLKRKQQILQLQTGLS